MLQIARSDLGWVRTSLRTAVTAVRQALRLLR